ncbi:chromate efflux transporter, partial [Actinocorallia lasiicapitis]
MDEVRIGEVVRAWGWIGGAGFGGPPTHIRMLRELCVERRGWIGAGEFEDAVAACNLLPGPSSTQLAIFAGWRVRGRAGAVAGGLAFILPGLALIVLLSALFLAGNPPEWVRARAAGDGSAVAAVAVDAGWGLVASSRERAPDRRRWLLYLAVGGVAGAEIGPWLVLVLLACGFAELGVREPRRAAVVFLPVGGIGGLASLSWTAFKVGALSYGGGFVIIPLMQADAVGHGWMTAGQFLNAVALGQITPGPVVHTVAAVGYAAAGVTGALLAAAVAFGPSFGFVLVGAGRFGRLRSAPRI